MKIAVINGSPKGNYSITVQTVNPLTNATEYDATHPEKDNFVIEEAF